MSKFSSLLKAFVLVIITFIPTVSAAYTATTLPPVPKPVPVKVGLFIKDLAAINEFQQSLELEALITMQWKDPRLAFDPKKIGSDYQYISSPDLEKYLLANDIWFPYFEMANGHKPRNNELLSLIIRYDGLATLQERFNSELYATMHFRLFPFDTHSFNVQLRSFLHNNKEVKLIPWPKHQGVSEDSHLAEWKIIGHSFEVKNLPIRDTGKIASKYILHLKVKRQSDYYLFSILLPMVLIVLLSTSTLLMSQDLTAQIGLAVTCVLSIIAYEWTIFNIIPKIPYQVYLSALIQLTFVFVCSMVIIAILIYKLKNFLALKTVRRIRVTFYWLWLLLYCVLFAAITMYYFKF